MKHAKDNVWYAVYGTNLNDRRFSCYIKGGIPEGTSEADRGCRDKTDPVDGGKITLPFHLYFSKSSPKWGNGSVGFLGLQAAPTAGTLGRKYLITEGQFEDIFRQSNHIPADLAFSIDFEQIRQMGAMTLFRSWFGRIVFLGKEEGVPVFTMTAYWDFDPKEVSVPSWKYLMHFVKGLRQVYGFSDSQIVDYLAQKPGIYPDLSQKDLYALMAGC